MFESTSDEIVCSTIVVFREKKRDLSFDQTIQQAQNVVNHITVLSFRQKTLILSHVACIGAYTIWFNWY